MSESEGIPVSEEHARLIQEATTKIAKALCVRFGRMATSEEVEQFIMGDDETRTHIWNFGLPNSEKEKQ